MKYARKQEEQKGTNRFQKLMGQHIVFIVDECHRAVSAENMMDVKKYFLDPLGLALQEHQFLKKIKSKRKDN